MDTGEIPGTQMAGMKCGLFRSDMDAACNPVRMDTDRRKRYMHSGGTFVFVIERDISKRNLGIVFVFQ